MLRELLAALLGHPGDLFHCQSVVASKGPHSTAADSIADSSGSSAADAGADADAGANAGARQVRVSRQFRVAEHLPLLHPSERDLCNRLLEIGAAYAELDHFASGRSRSPEGQGRQSLYLDALKTAMAVVLDEYREAILQLEKRLLSEPATQLSHIHYALSKFRLLLPYLLGLVAAVEAIKDAPSSFILDLLFTNLACGMPDVREALLSLFNAVLQVFYNQLSAWLLHGRLVDPYNEFIVYERDNNSAASDDSDPSLSETAIDWSDVQFGLRASLPSLVPRELAKDILFVGAAVRVLRGGDKSSSSKAQKITSCRITHDDEQRFAADLNHARSSEFRTSNLAAAVVAIRTTVASHLWALVSHNQGLSRMLTMIHDIILLRNGALWMLLLDDTSTVLCSTPTANSEFDLNAALRRAAVACNLDNNAEFAKCSLRLSPLENPSAAASSSRSLTLARESLQVAFQIDWPLTLFFSAAVMSRYHELCRFLLAATLAQRRLHTCWKRLADVRQPNLPVLHLRNRLAFICNNLLQYFQSDIIIPECAIFASTLESASDFDTVVAAHGLMLEQIARQCFLGTPAILRTIVEVWSACHAFCDAVVNSPTPPAEIIERITKVWWLSA
ncbi:hypothetical protein, variant [Capsaspora owczarzaki ATCC 30864]|uniref:Spindle pole body component n=1 Tax=Capsaspora owczarzaki (strain ATCC 30864) TaxID=595528 RepID=A0A0D2UCW1_CAPO3|nr:hypothetical protein, variant [Capsaspora owczarzaki ATCC 30864]